MYSCNGVCIWYIDVFQVVQEYERAVIFRLGRVVSGGAKGPGKEYLNSISWKKYQYLQECTFRN